MQIINNVGPMPEQLRTIELLVLTQSCHKYCSRPEKNSLLYSQYSFKSHSTQNLFVMNAIRSVLFLYSRKTIVQLLN